MRDDGYNPNSYSQPYGGYEPTPRPSFWNSGLIIRLLGVVFFLSIGYVNRSYIFGGSGNVDSLFAQGKYDEVVTLCSQVIANNPQDATAYNSRGLAYFGKEQYEQALQDFNKSLEFDSHYADAYSNRGQLYLALSYYDAAIVSFTSAVEEDPHYADAYSGRAWAYYMVSRYDPALADAQKALDLRTDVLPLNIRGLVYSEYGNYVDAISDFSKALTLVPNEPTLLYNRALAYADLGQYDKAIADLNQSLSLTRDPALEDNVKHALEALEPD